MKLKDKIMRRKLERLLIETIKRAGLLWLYGLKSEFKCFFRISTTEGFFSLEECDINKKTDRLFVFEGFLFVLSRSLHDRTGDISISLRPGGLVLNPERPLPRGCELHLSVIAKVISEYGVPPGGIKTK